MLYDKDYLNTNIVSLNIVAEQLLKTTSDGSYAKVKEIIRYMKMVLYYGEKHNFDDMKTAGFILQDRQDLHREVLTALQLRK